MAAMRDIRSLRDRHPGGEFYVIGSGASLDYFDPEYFADKLTIAINWVADRRPLAARYTLTKYHDCALTLAQKYPDMDVIVSRLLYGNPRTGPLEADMPNLYAFDTRPDVMPGTSFSLERDWPTDPNHLVNSHSSITSGMHLAAYMGAKTIVMVGHDCDLTAGKLHFDGYRLTPDTNSAGWLDGFERQTLLVKRRLAEQYGCRVYGLLPFVNHHRRELDA